LAIAFVATPYCVRATVQRRKLISRVEAFMRKFAIGALALSFSGVAQADMTKTQFTAPNGVVVDVNTDEFAGRREYSAPAVKFTPDNGGSGGALVGEVFNDGKLLGITIQGFIVYSGDWRFYKTAIFKGGASAQFHSTGHDVGSCSYGCTLSEDFMIDIMRKTAWSRFRFGLTQPIPQS